MKVQANDLFKVIRQIVKEELQKQLPAAVQKHLSEAYVRRLVKESSGPSRSGGSGGSGVTGLLTNPDEDTQEIPEPKKNDDQGAYDKSNASIRIGEQRSKNNEHMRKLLERSNPLGFVYENVKVPGDEDEAAPSIPLDALGGDFAKMNEMLEGMDQVAKSKAPVQMSGDADALLEAKMNELQRRREQLEVKVLGR